MRILHYVRGITYYDLHYTRGDPMLIGYTNSDWAGSFDDHQSTFGYVFYIGTSVAWSCKKQQAIPLSSTKVEYRIVVHAIQEAL